MAATDTMMPMQAMPQPAAPLPVVDKARFHLLIDDAISKQVWLGVSQRALHNLMCGLGGGHGRGQGQGRGDREGRAGGGARAGGDERRHRAVGGFHVI
jgi:hypothetical protein